MLHPMRLIFPQNQTHWSGQVGVIMVLIMSVLLTVGLSVASNSTQDVENTRQEEESNRVFNAAEAGVEEALSSDLNFDGDTITGSVSDISDVDVDYSVTKVSVLDTRLFEGVGLWVDVSNAAAGNQLRFNFSKESNCSAGTEADRPASLLISIYNNQPGNTRVRHEAAGGCNRGDNFPLATTVSMADGYTRRYNVNLQDGDFLVTVKPLYNDTHIMIRGVAPYVLPTQGYAVRSEAQSAQGTETRIVSVNRSLPTAPSVFDYALFSGTTLVK